MMIPKLHYIAEGNTPKTILENIQKACASGIELVQLDIKGASEKKVLKIAKEAIKITSHYQTRLILKGHYKIAKTIKADGVFLEKTDTAPSFVRKHLHTWQSIGASANTLQDCEKLLDNHIDYIFLGPFKDTNQDQKEPILGINGFYAITDVLKTPTPIIGVGGITTEDVTDLLKADISGIAVASAITENFDRIKTFHQLLNASSTQEMKHRFD